MIYLHYRFIPNLALGARSAHHCSQPWHSSVIGSQSFVASLSPRRPPSYFSRRLLSPCRLADPAPDFRITSLVSIVFCRLCLRAQLGLLGFIWCYWVSFVLCPLCCVSPVYMISFSPL